MPINIAVIIPTKNEAANIRRCLLSIKRQTVKPAQIIVVDNHSTDNTQKLARQLGAIVCIQGPERSSQRNFGADKAKADYLFFIDADMELDSKVLSQATRLLKKMPFLKAIVIPEISVGQNYWARVRALERSCYLGEPTIEAPRIFDKIAFLKAGGFDQKLIAAEDWDLRQRIQRLGKIGRIKAKITHHEGRLSLKTHLRKKYYYAKNIRQYAKKNPALFKQQSNRQRCFIFLKNWKKMITRPIIGLGVLILKSLEYLAYLGAKIKK